MKLDKGKTRKEIKSNEAAKRRHEKIDLGKRKVWIEYCENSDVKGKPIISDGIPGKVCKIIIKRDGTF